MACTTPRKSSRQRTVTAGPHRIGLADRHRSSGDITRTPLSTSQIALVSACAASTRKSLIAETYLNTLTARAITSATVASETHDCRSIRSLAHRVIGSVSVGLNAVALVKDRYR